MTVLLVIGVGVVVTLAALYVRAWRFAGPCQGPRCKGRGWFVYTDGRDMCGDCCWLAEQECLDDPGRRP